MNTLFKWKLVLLFINDFVLSLRIQHHTKPEYIISSLNTDFNHAAHPDQQQVK